MQHSSRSYPVIHVFMFNGHPVNVRRRGGGTYAEAAVAFVKTMLPQNVATLQEVTDGQSAAGDVDSVSAGNPVRVGADARNKGAKR